jgi:predicted lipoprotein with Yx(FWY)xxD motif
MSFSSIGLASALVLVLGACNAAGAGAGSASPSASSAPSAASPMIQVADTSLGKVLVGSNGHTLYLFTKDSAGKSACSGSCAGNWPPLTVSSGEQPSASRDVGGELGTIIRDDGTAQVTIAGHPLYFYTPDQAAGDVNGQGKNDVWFAVTPAGEAVASSGPASASPSAQANASGAGYGY